MIRRLPSLAADSLRAAALFAVDPMHTALVGSPGPLRDQWLNFVRQWTAADAPWSRVPSGVTADRLLGGLDLVATLSAGRPVGESGILAASHGGFVTLAMAERMLPEISGILCATADLGEVVMERDGLTSRSPAIVTLIAFDEGQGTDESIPAALAERVALRVDLTTPATADDGVDFAPPTTAAVRAARDRLPTVTCDDELLIALAGAASALGIGSARAPQYALRAARAAAALDGRLQVNEQDLALAARLVLAPRATQCPEVEAEAEESPPPEQGPPESDAESNDDTGPSLEDLIVAAAEAALPEGLFEELNGAHRQAAARSRTGAATKAHRGRPVGVRSGDGRRGDRINVIATLRAAAPWQVLRDASPRGSADERRVHIERNDLRITVFKQATQTTTIFAVDASGSAAANRLAEAKGAVELMLADCYVRRDRVALIAFRGACAEVLLEPTHSLVRAKRALACFPAGGGTPLASGIDLARELAAQVVSGGQQPFVVVMTDGRANVTRAGQGNPSTARADAEDAARRLREANVATLFIDVSPRPRPRGAELAALMGGRYLPLPLARAAAISTAVQSAAREASRAAVARSA